jgi:hypothetical protein
MFRPVRESGPNLRVSKCREKVLIENTEVHMKRFFNIPLAIIILSTLSPAHRPKPAALNACVANIPFTFIVGQKNAAGREIHNHGAESQLRSKDPADTKPERSLERDVQTTA